MLFQRQIPRQQKPTAVLSTMRTTGVPLGTPKRNTSILGGPQKIHWRFFGDNLTREPGLFEPKNFLKSPGRRWVAKCLNRNWLTAGRSLMSSSLGHQRQC